MRMPYWGLFLVVFMLVSIPSFSQEEEAPASEPKKENKDVKKANDAYETLKYTAAIELLKEAFGEVKGREAKSDILFKLGECYRNINDYKNAEKNYSKAVKLGYKDPIAQLRYADMLKAQGEYEDALEAYQEYKKENPTDPMGDQGIESTKQAVEWQSSPSLYQVSNMEDLNTQYMDFSPIYGGKAKQNSEIIFASTREESTGGDEDEWLGQTFMDLYTTTSERKSRGRRRRGGNADNELDVSRKKWSTPILIDEEKILNTKYHEGPACFDSRKKKLYFTKCINEKEEQLGCGIWVTEVVGKSWKEPEQIFVAQDTGANIGHPNLSPDDKFLYFVSTDFNARGGRDIFVSSFDRRKKTWGTPQNLGPKVNTERDEYYPYSHTDGYLYFASNGLPGMGGLDIFRIKVGENGLPLPNAKVENMKFPINTNWDDFALIFEPGSDEKGFLSSNRKGGKGSDDIYAVFKTPVVFKLEGVVTSSKTGEVLEEVNIKLDGSDGTSVAGNSDKDGYYIFGEANIKKDVSYKLTFEKKQFLSNIGDITTVGISLADFEYLPSETKFMHTLRLNITLDPIDIPIVLPNVLFDVGKATLRPESQVALDTVVTILNNNPRIVIALRSHTDYTDTKERNQALSQRRADSSVAYLIKKGIDPARLQAQGKGEEEPYTIPEKYDRYGKEHFKAGTNLSESYIKGLSPELQAVANQINRRTDMSVLRDDYVPAEGIDEPEAADPNAIINAKKNEKPEAGKIYVVKGRESLGVIARKNKIKIQDLKRINGGLRGVRPFEGLQLKVDKDGNYEEWDESHYQITKRGETFKSIAKKLDMDDDDLEDLNPDVDKKMLLPGFWIKIK